LLALSAIGASDVVVAVTTVRVERLSVERGGTSAVEAVSFAVETGTWFGVIGANGSGKTSLLRAIAGRLPMAGGACLIDGVDLSDDRQARAAQIGFAVPPETLPAALTGAEVLSIVAGNVERALAAMGAVGEALAVRGLLDRQIGRYSAGMKQRLAIGCAFAEGRPVVVLDEPFNWLDPVAAFDLKQAVRAMVDGGRVVISALHDLPTLALACDAGLLLRAGCPALAIAGPAVVRAQAAPAEFEREMIAALRGEDQSLTGAIDGA
jgi:ABC-2 type transport system ATP-binding protein